jgi:hypothetical protein
VQKPCFKRGDLYRYNELPQQVVVHKSADPKKAKPGGKNVKLPAAGAAKAEKKAVESQFF